MTWANRIRFARIVERKRKARRPDPVTKPLVFGLGSNVGDCEGHLVWALHRLAEAYGPLRIAPLFRSRAISPLPQSDYLNTVAWVDGVDGESRLRPPQTDRQWLEVIARLKGWERVAGRRDGPRFGPRPLDIDLLIWGDAHCVVDGPDGERPEEAGVIVPHPRWWQRRFVLEPLAALCPELRPPGQEMTVGQRLAALGDDQEVEQLGWNMRRLVGWVAGQHWSPSAGSVVGAEAEPVH